MMKMYVLKELVSGFTTKECRDRIAMIHAAHLLNKSSTKERWTVCAV
jgi:hypothetical protein